MQPLLKNPDRPLYLNGSVPETRLPMVSIVVCSYNGARTLRDCMVSLQNLHYPNYEVIFVDDGSKDNTQEIMTDFPGVRNIVQVNKGLSAARNVGIAAAKGEVVAFTDSDCMADRDWLYFLVHTLLSGDYAAVGGPEHFAAGDGLDSGHGRCRARLAEPRPADRHDRGACARLQHGLSQMGA